MEAVDYESMSLAELAKLLNERQRRFAEELDNGGTEAEAYIRAGFSARGAAASASRLLKNAKFAAYRRARSIDLYAKRGVTPEWVGNRLTEIVERCMDGKPHLSWNSEERAWLPDGTWMFDHRGAIAALKAIGESMGMFKPETVKKGGQTVEINILTPPDGGGIDE